MNDDLGTILHEMAKPGAPTSPAFDQLLDDYTRFHLILAIVGGLFTLALVVASVLCWRAFAHAPKRGRLQWSFEKWVYAGFGLLAALVAATLALIVAANISNVLNPRAGLGGAIGLLGEPRPGSTSAQLQDAVAGWLRSDNVDMPTLLQSAIDDRLSWQRPKAIICTVLLIAFVALTVAVWRRLIRMSRPGEPSHPLRRALLLVVGVLCVPACLLLMLMVMGNVQGTLAPMSLTLFHG